MRTTKSNPSKLDFTSRLEQKVNGLLLHVPFAPSRRQYNLTISHERKFIWFRVAKVGTRSLFGRLRQSGVPLEVENASNVYYSPQDYPEYFKFGFVRNPWDRLVSCWWNKVKKSNHFQLPDELYARCQEFEGFVDWVAGRNIDLCDRHMRSQSALIDLNNVDYIGRMENFEQDVTAVFKRIGVDPENRYNENRYQRGKHYSDYYTPTTRDKVADIYRKDVQIFGYQFEG